MIERLFKIRQWAVARFQTPRQQVIRPGQLEESFGLQSRFVGKGLQQFSRFAMRGFRGGLLSIELLDLTDFVDDSDSCQQKFCRTIRQLRLKVLILIRGLRVGLYRLVVLAESLVNVADLPSGVGAFEHQVRIAVGCFRQVVVKLQQAFEQLRRFR